MKAHQALYGNVAIYRAKCPSCKGIALISRNGQSSCCKVDVERPPEAMRQKRISLSPSLKRFRNFKPYDKNRALEAQNFRCAYCRVAFDVPFWCQKRDRVVDETPCFDHFVPWIHSFDSREGNIVASCSVCNGIKASKVFASIEDASTYIIKRRRQRGYQSHVG